MKDKVAEVKVKFRIHYTIFVVSTTKNCLLRNAIVFDFVILKECIYLHDAFAFAESERDVGGSRKVRPRLPPIIFDHSAIRNSGASF
jgi:hypothetical protein